MDSLQVAQLVVKAGRFLPFGLYAVLVILSRTLISPRSARTAMLMGGAAATGMVGWLLRYFLEQSNPEPRYAVSLTSGVVLSLAAPAFLHDLAAVSALVIAFGAVVMVLPPKE